MRNLFSFIAWAVGLVWAALNFLATIDTLPDDLQSFWDTHMSGVTVWGHVFLLLTASMTLYLYWPLLRRWFGFPKFSDGACSHLELETATCVFRDNVWSKGAIAGYMDAFDDPQGYFLAYVGHGLNDGWKLKVTGVPSGGDSRQALPLPIRVSSVDDMRHPDGLVAADNRKYLKLRFERKSLIKFAKKWGKLEQDAKPKTSPQGQN